MRYCGFWQVRKEFLSAFVHEVSQYSSKGYFPSLDVGDEEVLACIQVAEQSLKLAAQIGDANPSRGATLIQQSLEDVAQVTLRHFGTLPRPSTGQSFPALIDRMRTSQQVGNSRLAVLPELRLIGIEISSAFEHHGVSTARFMDDWDKLGGYLAHGSSEKCPTRHAASLAQRLVNGVSAVLHPDAGVQLPDVIESTEEVARYLGQVARILLSRQIEFIIDAEKQWVEFDVDQDYHPLLKLGRQVRAWILPSEVVSLGTMTTFVDRIRASIASESNRLQVVVCDPQDFSSIRQQLKRIALTTESCVLAIARKTFEDGVRGLSNLVEAIDENFGLQVPESRAWLWGVFEDILVEFPDEMPAHERTALAQAVGQIKKDFPSDACATAGRQLELYVRQVVYAIHWHLSVAGDQYAKEVGPPLAKESHGKMGFRQCVDWLDEVVRKSKTIPAFGRAISAVRPKDELVNKLKKLITFRNEVTHNDKDIDIHHAVAYVTNVGEAISTLFRCLNRPRKAVVTSISKESVGVLVELEADAREISTALILRSKELALQQGSCIFVTDVPGEFIPATLVCHCGTLLIGLRGCGANGEFSCAPCTMRPPRTAKTHQVDKAWKTLLQRALAGGREPTGVRRSQEMRHMSLREGVKRTRDWIGALGEGMAHLAIHVEPVTGAILSGLLSMRDDDARHETNCRIEAALSSQSLLTEELQSLIAKLAGHYEKSEYLAEMLSRQLNGAYAHTNSVIKAFDHVRNPEAWSVEVLTSIPEHVLSDELERLVGRNMEVFWADIEKAGFQSTRIKLTGAPTADIFSVVCAFRGMDLVVVSRVISRLAENYPGSAILRRAIDELARWLPSQTETIEGAQHDR